MSIGRALKASELIAELLDNVFERHTVAIYWT